MWQSTSPKEETEDRADGAGTETMEKGLHTQQQAETVSFHAFAEERKQESLFLVLHTATHMLHDGVHELQFMLEQLQVAQCSYKLMQGMHAAVHCLKEQ